MVMVLPAAGWVCAHRAKAAGWRPRRTSEGVVRGVYEKRNDERKHERLPCFPALCCCAPARQPLSRRKRAHLNGNCARLDDRRWAEPGGSICTLAARNGDLNLGQRLPGRRRSRFDLQHHLVVGHLAADHQARALHLREALDDGRHLARLHEHAAHLGGLVGAAQPALMRVLVRPVGQAPGSSAEV